MIFLVHEIDGKDIYIAQSKINSLVDCPAPKIVLQDRSFLEFVNFIRHFLKNLEKLLEPLIQLTCKDINW